MQSQLPPTLLLLQVPFRQTAEGLLPRPWAVDNLDAALNALTRPQPHAHALIFVDNAGSDVVLGDITGSTLFLHVQSDNAAASVRAAFIDRWLLYAL